MDDSLRRAARQGNVSDLYTLIQKDGNVLKRFDKVEFIDTPLHIAADAGCIDFAMEVMSLKPSFARKLNPQGLTPLHLAIEKGHEELVLLLLENDKGLVRVKGKKGETPLHYLITREENSEVRLLHRFLEVCPESIRDLTTENQTALHITVRNNKEKAFTMLCKVLWNTNYLRDVVNQKDRNGDTVLHLAARHNRHKMIKFLFKYKVNKYATNQVGLMALDVAQQSNNRESIRILRDCFIPSVSTFMCKSQEHVVKYVREASSVIFHSMDNISSDDRNALLVILGLLLTATFQACLSPPGGVWQGDISSNSNITEGHALKVPGKSVMDKNSFLVFYIPTCAVFIVTFFLTLGLLKPYPHGFKTALQVLLAFLAICFDESIHFLAPTNFASYVIDAFSVLVFVLMMFMCFAYRVSRISVLILGLWLFPYRGTFLVTLVLVFRYEELWKGSIIVVGLSLFIGLSYQSIIDTIAVLGLWSFLWLCRFCIKQCNERCNA